MWCGGATFFSAKPSFCRTSTDEVRKRDVLLGETVAFPHVNGRGCGGATFPGREGPAYCSVPSPAATASSEPATAAPIMAVSPATIMSTLMDAVPSPIPTTCSAA